MVVLETIRRGRMVSVVQEASYWLALLCDGPLKQGLAKRLIHRWCVKGQHDLSSLGELSPSDLVERFQLDVQQAADLMEAMRKGISRKTALLDDLGKRGVGLITRLDVAYPEALVEHLPEEWLPYFGFYRGDMGILTEPPLAILGGRQPPLEAQKAATELARMLSQDDHRLVGGYEQGIDRLALDAAREAGAETTIMLPMGLDRFDNVLSTMEDVFAQGRLLALSPYAPDRAYSAALARAGRVLVMALCEAMVLFAPDRAPSDWPLMTKLLEAGAKVFIWDGMDDEVTRAWISGGATPFADVSGAHDLIRDLFGMVPDSLQVREIETEGYGDLRMMDKDAAVEVLRRSGNVPEALARRLRDSVALDDE